MPTMPKHVKRPGAFEEEPEAPKLTAAQIRTNKEHAAKIAALNAPKGKPPVKTKMVGTVKQLMVDLNKPVKKAPARSNAKTPVKKEPALTQPSSEAPIGFKLPKTMAECADLLYTTRNKRLEEEKKARESQKAETYLTEYIIANLPKSKANGIIGQLAKVERKTKDIYQVDDWPVFYANVKRKGAFFLLNKALSVAAVKEIYDSGKTVPGVAKHTRAVLSITKR